jgi:peptidoglycan/LPS O-acetylase OafA/YrhL
MQAATLISREKASPTHRRGWLNLRRITSGSSWIPEIDGLRFIAILLVVLYHLSAQIFAKSDVPLTMQPWYAGLFTLLGRGDIGVRIFFVISGFILGRPFARHYLLGHPRPSLSTYYLRRLTRLEPPYLINIAVCAVSIMLYAHTPFRAVFPAFAASAFYLHGFFFRGTDFINPVAWTLEMEVQFYLLVPLLTLVYLLRNRWLRRSLLGAICIALPAALELLVFGKISGTSHFWATIGWWLQYFLAGMLLSDIYVTEIPTWRASWLWDVVSGTAWCVLVSGISRLYPLEPLLIALAFIGAFRGVLLHRLFTIEWLAIVGGMCYSLYLWHFFIIALVFKVSRRVLITHDLLANFLIQSALILPCILGFSVLYFVFIERPCMDPAWPQKLKTAVSGHSRRSEVA